MRAAEFIAGLVIIGIVFADVFSSVLVPRPSHSKVKIGLWVARLLAPLWRGATRLFRSPRLRQDFRGNLAPLILVGAGVGWIAGLAFGFALMLHALPGEVDLANMGFGEALFQSTLAVSTLGLVHAEVHGWGRAVVAIAGVSGFSVLTLVVAFLLSIQTGLHERESLVLTMMARAGRPPNALAIIGAYADAVDEEFGTLFDAWEHWSARVLQSHLSYPILFRFRSLDENAEWLSCLGAVLDAAAVISAAEPKHLPRTRRAAGFLTTTASRAIREFSRAQRSGDDRASLNSADIAAVERALTRSGCSPTAPAAFAERLDALRAGYAGRLAPLAAQIEIVWHDTLTGLP